MNVLTWFTNISLILISNNRHRLTWKAINFHRVWDIGIVSKYLSFCEGSTSMTTQYLQSLVLEFWRYMLNLSSVPTWFGKDWDRPASLYWLSSFHCISIIFIRDIPSHAARLRSQMLQGWRDSIDSVIPTPDQSWKIFRNQPCSHFIVLNVFSNAFRFFPMLLMMLALFWQMNLHIFKRGVFKNQFPWFTIFTSY